MEGGRGGREPGRASQLSNQPSKYLASAQGRKQLLLRKEVCVAQKKREQVKKKPSARIGMFILSIFSKLRTLNLADDDDDDRDCNLHDCQLFFVVVSFNRPLYNPRDWPSSSCSVDHLIKYLQ